MSDIKLQAYIAAVSSGSLTKAAEQLGYTQPSISHMIHSLEDEYGFSLLTRSKKGVEPTKNGEELLPLMIDIIQRNNHLSEAIYNIQGLNTGTIRIGAFTSICVHWLPPLLKRFNAEYPNIDFEIFEGNKCEIVRWLTEGTIDFALCTEQPSHHFMPLQEDEMVALLPHNHATVAQSVFPLASFQTESIIMPYADSSTDVQKIFEKAHINPNIAYRIRGDEAIMAMVQQGFGISLTSKLLMKNHLQHVAILPLEPAQSRMLGVLSNHPIKELSPASKKFIPYFKEWLSQQ